jgi:hypothetical protein
MRPLRLPLSLRPRLFRRHPHTVPPCSMNQTNGSRRRHRSRTPGIPQGGQTAQQQRQELLQTARQTCRGRCLHGMLQLGQHSRTWVSPQILQHRPASRLHSMSRTSMHLGCQA